VEALMHFSAGSQLFAAASIRLPGHTPVLDEFIGSSPVMQ